MIKGILYAVSWLDEKRGSAASGLWRETIRSHRLISIRLHSQVRRGETMGRCGSFTRASTSPSLLLSSFPSQPSPTAAPLRRHLTWSRIAPASSNAVRPRASHQFPKLPPTRSGRTCRNRIPGDGTVRSICVCIWISSRIKLLYDSLDLMVGAQISRQS